mgnify:CR=1 FL=1
MTGGRTFGVASKDFADTFTKNTGRAPFMWINWPCSDNSKSHLIMGGYDTFLHPGVDPSKIQGIVLNPMQQSEPSKQGIFMAADYSWNLWQSEKDGQQSWEDSFSYIDHNSPIASKGSRGLRDLAMNMRILNDGGIDGAHKDAEYDAVNKWWINNESVDYTGKLDVKGVLTELKGKLDGIAIRVPTPNVSIVDLNCVMKRDVTVDEVNAALTAAANDNFGVSDEPLVSIDYNGDTHGGVVDLLSTSVMSGNMLKVLIWYDNEAGFTNQLLRLITMVGGKM